MKVNPKQLALNPHQLTKSEVLYLSEQIIKIFNENGVPVERIRFFLVDDTKYCKINIGYVDINSSTQKERMDLELDLFIKEISNFFTPDPSNHHYYILNLEGL